MGAIVTIDGPSGVGKTAIAGRVAKELELPYLPSGTLYRVAAWAMMQQGINLNDEIMTSSLIQTFNPSVTEDGRIGYEGQEASARVQTPEMGMAAATIAHYPAVRDRLTFLQQEFGRKHGCVIEGRSTAIEIFPNADVKIWLTADLKERMKRKRQAATTMEARDAVDRQRLLAPMQVADGAFKIDSTHMTIDETVREIVGHCRQALSR